MVRILGEKAADILLTALIGCLSFLVLRDFEQQRRLTTVEAGYVTELRIVGIEERFAGMQERQGLMLEEIMALRQGIGEMLMPILTEFIQRGMPNEEVDIDSGGGDLPGANGPAE